MRSLVTGTLLLLMATTALANREVTHRFDSETPAPAVKRVVIDLPSGSIRLRNGADGVIRVTGSARREYDDSPRYDQQIVDDSAVEAYVNRDDGVIRRRFGPNAQGWRAQRFTSFDVTIEVPPGTAVQFLTNYGNVDAHGSFGDLDVALRAGNVSVTTPRAEVRQVNAACRVGTATTNFGEEIVQREGVLPGSTQYFNQEGHTRIHAHVTAGNLIVTLTR